MCLVTYHSITQDLQPMIQAARLSPLTIPLLGLCGNV